jgi:chromosome partitioning protein
MVNQIKNFLFEKHVYNGIIYIKLSFFKNKEQALEGEMEGSMKVISVATLKGGVGKTTTAVTLASILAKEYGKKVLLIDVDPQANSTSYMRLDETASSYLSIKNIFENDDKGIREIVKETFIENLYMIGSTILLTGTEMKLITIPAREFVLKRYFSKNKDYLTNFDYIIFDTNPSMNVINQNVFIISDSIILLSDVGIGAFKGIELFDFLWQDISDKLCIENNIKSILLTKVKARTNMSKEYKELLSKDEFASKKLLNSYIRDSIKLAEAELAQKPVNLYNSSSTAATEYREVVKELMEKQVI